MWLLSLTLSASARADDCGSEPVAASADLAAVLQQYDEDCPPPLPVGDGPIEPIPDPLFWELSSDGGCPPPLPVGDGPIEPIPDPLFWELDSDGDSAQHQPRRYTLPGEPGLVIEVYDTVPEGEGELFLPPQEDTGDAEVDLDPGTPELDEPAPFTGLPGGALGVSELSAAYAHIAANGGTLRDMLELLSDGKTRTISGEVIRDLSGDILGELGALLPLSRLESITAGDGFIDIAFDGAMTIDTPATTAWVYRRGQARQLTEEGRSIRVAETVRFYTDPEAGITGLRAGDIQPYGGFFVGYVNVDIRMEHAEGAIAYMGGDPLLQVGDDGQPLMVDGRYQYQRYDNWLVIDVPFIKDIRIGLSAL